MKSTQSIKNILQKRTPGTKTAGGSKPEEGGKATRSFGIGMRLYLALAALASITVVSSVVSLYNFKNTSDTVDMVVRQNMTSVMDSVQVSSAFSELNGRIAEIINAKTVENLQKAYDTAAALHKTVAGRVTDIPLPEQDRSNLASLVGEIEQNLSALHNGKDQILTLEAETAVRVRDMDNLHGEINTTILPAYDDAEFSLLIEIDKALEKTPQEAKRFVTGTTASMTNLLKLSAELNAIRGVYLATHSLSESAMLVPYRDNFTASAARVNNIISGFSGPLAPLKEKTVTFLSYGSAEDSLFARVGDLIERKRVLAQTEQEIKSDQAAIGAIMAGFSGRAQADSESGAERLQNQLSSSTSMLVILLVVFLISVAGIIFLFIRPLIVRRIIKLSEAMEEIRQGNLDYAVVATGSDEISRMTGALARFRDDARHAKTLEAEQKALEARAEAEKREAMTNLANSFESRIQGIISNVVRAAQELQQSSTFMTHTIGHTSDKAENVSRAASEASQNIQSIVTASSEVSSSIQEISDQLTKSNAVIQAAVDHMNEAGATSKMLEEATQTIGEIMEMIQGIAGQINLLALNATIESARAGEAGKGFAVVAGEVKQLATQTTSATDEVAESIVNIRSVSQRVIIVLDEIRGAIDSINNVSSVIAAAVEEQSTITQGIVHSMNNAAASTDTINHDIGDVSASSREASVTAQQTENAATKLSHAADSLDSEVKSFLSEIRQG